MLWILILLQFPRDTKDNAMSKLQIDTSVVDKFEEAIADQEKLFKVKNQIYRKIIVLITPLIRSMLVENYKASGIQNRTGKLLSLITAAIVFPTKKGLFISLARGAEKKQYVKAASLNYGSVRGEGTKGLNKRQRKNVKKGKQDLSQSGIKRIKPKKYFYLTETQKKKIELEFNKALRLELTNYLKNRKAA